MITGSTSLSTDAANNRVAATLTSDTPTLRTTGGHQRQMQFGGADRQQPGARGVHRRQHLRGGRERHPGRSRSTARICVGGDTTAQAGKLYLLSSGARTAAQFAAAVRRPYCQCQYLQWGYWGGDLRTGNSNNDTISRIDRGGINFWTAGQTHPMNDINTLASQRCDRHLYRSHDRLGVQQRRAIRRRRRVGGDL